MAYREPLALAQLPPLREADFEANTIQFAPHRHRYAPQVLVDLVLELELTNHKLNPIAARQLMVGF
jgi:hypothetical protein